MLFVVSVAVRNGKRQFKRETDHVLIQQGNPFRPNHNTASDAIPYINMHEEKSGIYSKLIYYINHLILFLSQLIWARLQTKSWQLKTAKKDRKVRWCNKIKQHYSDHWNLVKFLSISLNEKKVQVIRLLLLWSYSKDQPFDYAAALLGLLYIHDIQDWIRSITDKLWLKSSLLQVSDFSFLLLSPERCRSFFSGSWLLLAFSTSVA